MSTAPTANPADPLGRALTLDVAKLLRDYGDQLLQRLSQKPMHSAADVRTAVLSLSQQYAAELARSDERGLRAASGDFNRWIGELFELVDRGCLHEDLIRQFLRDLERLIELGKSDALFAAVIEQVTDGQHAIGYRLGPTCGAVHAEHWKNFARHIEGTDSSPFLDGLFAQDTSLPLLLADWVPGYDKLFDSFARTVLGLPHRAQVPEAFWLTAASLLTSSDAEPRRIVFIAYRNIGTALIPNPGKGAAYETRVLDVLRIAYGQIARQEATMQRMLVEQREDIIKSLYPTIYSHDFQTPVHNIHSQMQIARRRCRELGEAVLANAEIAASLARPVTAMAAALGHSSRAVTDLHLQMRAYAVLESLQTESWSLDQGIEVARSLTQRRMKAAGVSFEFDSAAARLVELIIDQGMVVVVLFNLFHNAINMMEEAAGNEQIRQRQRREIRLLVRQEPRGEHVQLVVANTDTDVAREHRVRIFKKGFTTRRRGGGRGLFLSRQVCAHLGGSIELLTGPSVTASELNADFRVAFAIRLPCQSPSTSAGMMREAVTVP